MTMSVVEHEIGSAREVADRVIYLDQGVILEQGPRRRLRDDPRGERTCSLLARALTH
jgi:polar amino acid transport system ATP-binding protein